VEIINVKSELWLWAAQGLSREAMWNRFHVRERAEARVRRNKAKRYTQERE